MGDGCQPKNLLAIVRAKGQITGDIFSEAERVKNYTPEQRYHYEKVIADHFGLSPKKTNQRSKWDVMAARSAKGKRPGLADARLYNRPSEQFSQKFFNGVDRKIAAWANGKNADRTSYNEKVAKPVRTLIAALDKTVLEHGGKSSYKRELARFGLDPDTVYDARDWLKWLADGGHLKSQGNAKPFTDKAGQIARAQANLNLVWTMGNGVDGIRIASHYLGQRGGFRTLVEGTAKTLKNNPIKRQARFEKLGLYDTQFLEVSGKGADPFSLSIRAQKNWVAHIEEARAGDIKKGVRDTIFDSSPWDRPRYDRFEGSDLVFGLARYPINETRWLWKTSKSAMSILTPKPSPTAKRDAVTMGTYLIVRTALTGVAAQIPMPLYQAMSDEWKETVKEIEKKYNLNLIKIVSGAALKQIGMNANIDLSGYIQPLGGSLGSRANQVGSTFQGIVRGAGKTAVDLGQGKFAPAAVNAVATGFALANFGALGGSLSLLSKKAPVPSGAIEAANKLENSVLNSTTITKLLNTTAKGMEEEFTADKWKMEGLRAIVGENVKKGESAPAARMGRRRATRRRRRA